MSDFGENDFEYCRTEKRARKRQADCGGFF